jgi:hypothetical protein
LCQTTRPDRFIARKSHVTKAVEVVVVDGRAACAAACHALALFYNPTSGTRSQALQLRSKIGYKFEVAKAKVFSHLEALVRIGPVIPHSKVAC